MTKSGEREMTAEEAADALGVHRQTLSRWVRRGLLSPIRRKARGEHVYTEGELRRFLEEEGEHDAYWWAQKGKKGGGR